MSLSKSSRLVLLPNTLDPSVELSPMLYQSGFPNVTFKIPQRVIYHYVPFDNAINIIKGRCLKFSSAETFNDPFDLYDGLVDFKCRGKNQIREWVNLMNPGATATLRQNQRREIEALPIEKFEQMAKDHFKKRREISGICCFSKEPNVSLMWSHYANKHSGICFGFEFLPVGVDRDTHLTIHEVDYISAINPVNYYTKMPEAFYYWIKSKSTVWGYEKEVRAFINDRHKCDLFPFYKGCLKEVYFGCRVEYGQRLVILRLLEEYGYDVDVKQRMVIDSSQYSVNAVAI